MKHLLPSVLLGLTLSTLTLANPIQPLVPRASSTSPALATLTPAASPPSSSAVTSAIDGCSNINLSGVTRNDITSGLPCKPFTLIFARGTFEAGNLGGLVGPPFIAALNAQLGASNVAVQGVNNYPADVAGFLAGGSASGSADMAALIQQTLLQCPKTKLCVSGYSQGAQVAHNAANMISSAASAFINSVVLFGDPDDGSAFGSVPASKVSTDCHATDDICLHGDLILPSHLDYCLDVNAQASFAVAQSGL